MGLFFIIIKLITVALLAVLHGPLCFVKILWLQEFLVQTENESC